MLSFSQKLSISQKLSPQQIQYQKLLQLNIMSLEQRIKEEMEMNPLLEDELLENEELIQEQESEDPLDFDDDFDVKSDSDEYDSEDYMNEGDLDSDRLNSSPDDDDKSRPVAPSKVSVTDNLLDQLHLMDETHELRILGEMIIQSLNKDGYLKVELESLVDDLEMFDHIKIELSEAEKLLKRIQIFDPIGIASRNLQECLLVQLANLSYDPYYTFLAEEVLTKHYNDFVNKRFTLLESKLNLTETTLKQILDLIHKLNPRPGEGNISSEQANQISPDFTVEKNDDNFIVSLNDKSAPSLTLSSTYLKMLESNKRKRKISPRQKETHKFLREKFESAKWFIASIQQRRNTLMQIMTAIVEKQYTFFESGPKALRPMIYKDIAEEIQMDISTISRVVNGKYVQSPVGIHELKYFFSEGLETSSGEEISNKHIKVLLKELIDGESKRTPLSDDKLKDLLNEEGIRIARRTVAKYREAMMLPVARLRKEI
ncbi:MAG: RNA polymerase factor sigma-54 [Melioribacteraceae bacterium]|jgi:RNA polymerase sigma-54 factor|nr:RNA polymerase factor sigma-54 [Melioribacteraceae bacterium]